MKELYKYLCESVLLFEGGFNGTKDWKHHGDYNYVKSVINVILNNDEISTKTGVYKYKLDDNQKKALNDILENPEKYTFKDFNNIFNNELKWTNINKIPFSIGDRVKTADQENATCLVFNTIAKSSGTLKDGQTVESIAKTICEQFDPIWIKTFEAQSQFIIDLVDLLHKKDPKNNNLENFRLRRFGDKILKSGFANGEIIDTDIAEQTAVVDNYKKFIQQYTYKQGQKQKDIYDPSDVLLINTKKIKEINDALKQLTADLDILPIEQVRTNFQKLFYEGIHEGNSGCGLYGISLKKLNIKDDQIQGNIGIVNMSDLVKNDTSTKDLETNNIKVTNIEEISISSTGLTFNMGLDGKFNIEDLYFNKKEKPKNNSCIFTIRSSGDITKVGVDVKFSNNEPSMGKCPVALFKHEFAINSQKVTDIINEVKDKYLIPINQNTEQNDENNKKPQKNVYELKENLKDDFIDKVTRCVQAAIKRQPTCLPFIIIH